MQDASSMIPTIANASFERLCDVDDYISFIWSRRYYDVGDFELTISAASRNRQHMMQGNYVIRDGLAECGIIEQIEITVDLNNQEVMVVSGRFLSSILGRRIIAQQTQVSGTIESCVKALVNQNAISPQNSARKLPNLTYGAWSIPATTMEQQFTGKNLLEVIEDLCKTYEIGFRIDLTSTNGFSLVLYSGIDRSYDQTANPYIIFSNDYENLASSDYSENYQSIVTDVLVAGEGEGLSRKTVWASSGNARGLARRELFVDARNASTNDGEISDSVYYAQLKEEGLESIAGVTQAFAGEVYLTNFDLGTDFDVGDIVVIENAKWGISANARLIEVIESVSEAGVYTITPTFAIGGSGAGGADTSGYLKTEAFAEILQEHNALPLLHEAGTYDAEHSPYTGATKISELSEASTLSDGDWLAVATPTETKKVAYSTLKGLLGDYDNLIHKPQIEGVTLQGNKTYEELNMYRLSNSEIENLLS